MLTHQHLFSVMLAHATTLDDVYFHSLKRSTKETKGRAHDVNSTNLTKKKII
jgi:hypothetical protein